MLKGLHKLLTAPLLTVLAEMGHGDELAIVDANFPATANARRLVRLDGHDADAVLQAVLTLLPLDEFVAEPAAVMTPKEGRPPVIAAFQALLDAADGRPVAIEDVERFAFYERSRAAYAIVATGERRLYGNLIVKKGVIRPEDCP